MQTGQSKQTKKRFQYSTPDCAVTYDNSIRKTTKDLYQILVAEANVHTHEVYISLKKLASLLGRAVCTTQRSLRELEKHGIISIIRRKAPHNSKWNLINCFVIHGRYAEKYVGTEFAPAETCPEEKPKMRLGGRKNEALNTQELKIQEEKKITLRREAETPQVIDEARPKEKEKKQKTEESNPSTNSVTEEEVKEAPEAIEAPEAPEKETKKN